MKLYDIVFSPTGGTQKVSAHLTKGLGGNAVSVDLTDSKQDFHAVQLTQDDVAVIAVPSYGGRVPAVASERLGHIKAHGARAVLVCVYGNRAYEDTLVELEDAAKQAGFRVVAAVAAIAEHSIARQFAATDRMRRTHSSFPHLLARFRTNFLRTILQNRLFPETDLTKKLAEQVWSLSPQSNAQNAAYAQRNVLCRQSTPKIRKKSITKRAFLVCGVSLYVHILPARLTPLCFLPLGWH